ncbi:cytochrome P450 [Thelonectria olida]|uniref:Cytochrome P450 n=1 Tax=Thelonectria olida TaxID=1576542 RepID=A0A9P9ATW4_9HYPO|nr:cytochrome P450 [Thelonectria olida]
MSFTLNVSHLALVFLTGTTYLLARAIYDLFYHPLRIYPGPKLWAVSRLPLSRVFISGKAHHRVRKLHDRYGPVVRVAPDELSYCHPDAWHEIMGHRGHGVPENPKDLTTFPTVFHKSILAANSNDHARMRRVSAPRFSATALKRQEDTLSYHVDLLILQLHEHCQNGKLPLDIISWINCATLDIISALVFGESFHCLQSTSYHSFVSLIFKGIKLAAYLACVRKFAFVDALLSVLTPRRFTEKPETLFPWSSEQISRLLEDDKNNMRQQEEDRLTKQEVITNASVFLVAGSETSATAISAAVFYLASDQLKLATLAQEVRSSFKHESEITSTGLQGLPYLNAVLEESLRMYPPVAGALPRKIAKGGCVLLGRHVPENTLVSIWQWPLYRNPNYFVSPDSFLPERWLNIPRLGNNSTRAFRPFSYGPRDCLGKSLAYIEMRLILARIIWNFDVQITEESQLWEKKSRSYIAWEKGRMLVYLMPRTG